MISRLTFLRAVVSLMLMTASVFAQSSSSYNRSFYSVRNKERAKRKSTTLIILHTTEAPSTSALRKLSDLGECHYAVDERGVVYSIIDVTREAYHAGRSMWNGQKDVDNFSVGIEVCGYHNRALNAAQMTALSALVKRLQSLYSIPDYRVIPHSAVAYGAPNKWQKSYHRGRKRCGMLFATASIRARLGLKTKPGRDPDVSAGRLVVGDPYLAQMLYGSPALAARIGADNKNAKSVPSPTRSALQPSSTPPTPRSGSMMISRDFRGSDIDSSVAFLASTIYLYPDGNSLIGSQMKPDRILKLPYGTRVLFGYAVGGPVSAKRPVSYFCGNKWNDASTYYVLNGEIVMGTAVKAEKIPSGTLFFYKK